uniref:Ig-like domain-containing protein n=1 Tax=Nothobranchius furzeri TaxID=105023 RepID=A0A8C6PAN0_NOTFU
MNKLKVFFFFFFFLLQGKSSCKKVAGLKSLLQPFCASVKPKVSVYPAALGAHPKRKTFLVCLASGMFPPHVRFFWKRQKVNGPLEDLPADEEQLELTKTGRTTSIRTVDPDPLLLYNYSCQVKHEHIGVEATTIGD